MCERSKIGTFLTPAVDVKTREAFWLVGANGEEA